jgi:Tat protein translocase TatB subunit
MFNIGPMELIVILLVALVIVGPKRLPEVGRSIGKSLRELRRATEDVRYSFESSLDDDDRHADGDVATDSTEADTTEADTTEEPGANGAEPLRRHSSSSPDEE